MGQQTSPANLDKSCHDHTQLFAIPQSRQLLLIETDFVFVRPLQGIPAADALAQPIGFRYLNMDPASPQLQVFFLSFLLLEEKSAPGGRSAGLPACLACLSSWCAPELACRSPGSALPKRRRLHSVSVPCTLQSPDAVRCNPCPAGCSPFTGCTPSCTISSRQRLDPGADLQLGSALSAAPLCCSPYRPSCAGCTRPGLGRSRICSPLGPPRCWHVWRTG